MKDSPYFRQAELILRAMPHVAAESCFALKGGTAINLFVRNLPRLSVDIDLAYLPVEEPRETALSNISEALGRIASVKASIGGARRIARPMRRAHALHPAAFLVDQDRGLGMPQYISETCNQCKDLLCILNVSLE